MQFLRSAEIIIGDNTTGKSIKDLRIIIEVIKEALATPNQCTVQIYNLSQSSRAQIQNEFTRIIVKAGYNKKLSIIFRGDIRQVTHDVKDADIITTIKSGDGDQAWQQSVASVTIGGGVGLQDTVTTLSGTFNGVGKGVLKGLDQPKVSDEDLVYSGATKDTLDHLSDTYKFDWWIQDNNFETAPRGGAVNEQGAAILISASTGMIGSPAITESGLNVKTLFNPDFFVGRYVKIVSKVSTTLTDNRQNKNTQGQGYYIIKKVTHNFDTRGDDGSTTLECYREGVI